MPLFLDYFAMEAQLLSVNVNDDWLFTNVVPNCYERQVPE
jgi:hypothetical protein